MITVDTAAIAAPLSRRRRRDRRGGWHLGSRGAMANRLLSGGDGALRFSHELWWPDTHCCWSRPGSAKRTRALGVKIVSPKADLHFPGSPLCLIVPAWTYPPRC